MPKYETFTFFAELPVEKRKELASKPITFLMSVDNKEGHKLEQVLQAAHDDLIVKCARLQPENCELSAQMLINNSNIVDLLEQAITLQNKNLEVLALFGGQDQGPAGKPRVNVDEGWRDHSTRHAQEAGRILRAEKGSEPKMHLYDPAESSEVDEADVNESGWKSVESASFDLAEKDDDYKSESDSES